MKRSIFFLVIMAFVCSINVGAQKPEKLFNGKNLSNWNFVVENNAEPAGQVYSVKDGLIHIKGAPQIGRASCRERV